MLRMELKPPTVRERFSVSGISLYAWLGHRELRSYRSRFHGKTLKEGVTQIVKRDENVAGNNTDSRVWSLPRYSNVKSGTGALETAGFRNTNFSVSFSSECGLKRKTREKGTTAETCPPY